MAGVFALPVNDTCCDLVLIVVDDELALVLVVGFEVVEVPALILLPIVD